MGQLYLQIITPEGVLVQEEVDMVEATATLGDFGVLPGHIKMLTDIKIGEIRYMKPEKTTYMATSGGFAEVVDDKVTFLVDTAEFAEEIDVERARRALERAEAALKELPTDSKEYRVNELAQLRALNRISVASKQA